MRSLAKPRAWFALSAAALIVGILAGALAPAPVALAEVSRQGATTVAVSPSQVALECGATKLVDVRINDVKDLYGVDIKVSYNPSVLEVVDANSTMAGVQIQSGNLPDTAGGQGLVQTNTVDTATGTISYVAVRLAPAAPQSGSGVIASITFRGKAAGTSPIAIASAMLSNQVAQPIQADLVNGQASVTCTGPTAPPPTATAAPGLPTAWPGKPTPWPGHPTPKPPHPPHPPYPPGPSCTYTVQPGDTLYSIARRYGTTVAEIQAANNITDPDLIFVGQTLVIPNCDGGTQPPPGQCIQYTVQPGDTLSGIAAEYCDSVYNLATRNGIVNPDCIFVGQVITVCPGCDGGGTTGCQAQYTVQSCDTLYSISLRYGVPVQAIADANNIADPNCIYVGQVLCIPY